MLNVRDAKVRELLLTGGFGLERETMRITADGHLAQTPDPFVGNPNVLRDFSENQLEINTPVASSPAEVITMLSDIDATVERTLAAQPQPEMLWPFSNPPYIARESDIAIAQYQGADAYKTDYRNYLADRYGRYKMALCGIHFNYSFSDQLLRASFAADGGEADDEAAFVAYKDQLYVTLAERAVAYGWLMMAITAASPLMDSSYVEKGNLGHDLYLGLGTVRCSELGYWNFFAPIIDYSSVPAYADSIQSYVDRGLIRYPSELYYPVRIKPRGAYSLDGLRKGNVSHIELRMFDVNPLYPNGINPADVLFGQLFLTWLAGTPRQPFTERDQVQAVQNFKNASHFDLKTVNIVVPNGEVYPVADAALNTIGFMEDFYRDVDAGPEVWECLSFQKAKFQDPENRYTYQVRRAYADSFVQKGLTLARQWQQRYL